MKLLPLFESKYEQGKHKQYYRTLPKKIQKFEGLLDSLNAKIEFEPQEEDISPADQFDDEKTLKWVLEQYNDYGNIYAWFCAKITVKYKGYEATDYLGACSYKDENDFKKGGYYDDMLNTCIMEINREVSAHNAEIQKKWNIRKANNLVKPYGYLVVQAVFQYPKP